MKGSILPTLSMQLQVITLMMTLANDNLVAPFSWAMGKLCPLSPLLALRTLLDWDAGFGLLSLDIPVLLHTSLVLTAPVTPPSPKPTVSGHSKALTSSARMTPANPGRLSFATLALPSLLGKRMEITSSSWLI